VLPFLGNARFAVDCRRAQLIDRIVQAANSLAGTPPCPKRLKFLVETNPYRV
jgi:hypothetical protein